MRKTGFFEKNSFGNMWHAWQSYMIMERNLRFLSFGILYLLDVISEKNLLCKEHFIEGFKNERWFSLYNEKYKSILFPSIIYFRLRIFYSSKNAKNSLLDISFKLCSDSCWISSVYWKWCSQDVHVPSTPLPTQITNTRKEHAKIL